MTALDDNVLFDLSRQVEHQLRYFHEEYCNNPAHSPEARLKVAEELFPAAAGSLAIVLGFVNIYNSTSMCAL